MGFSPDKSRLVTNFVIYCQAPGPGSGLIEVQGHDRLVTSFTFYYCIILSLEFKTTRSPQQQRQSLHIWLKLEHTFLLILWTLTQFYLIPRLMQSTWIPGDTWVGKTSIIHKSEKMQNRKRLENELKGSLFYFLNNGKHKSPHQFGEKYKSADHYSNLFYSGAIIRIMSRIMTFHPPWPAAHNLLIIFRW